MHRHEAEVYFQKDEGPPHYVLIKRQWLDIEFPDKWIEQTTHRVVSYMFLGKVRGKFQKWLYSIFLIINIYNIQTDSSLCTKKIYIYVTSDFFGEKYFNFKLLT